MKAHWKTDHKEDLKYVCMFRDCGNVFESLDEMREHFAAHKQERKGGDCPWEGEGNCHNNHGLGFADKGALRKHKRICHSWRYHQEKLRNNKVKDNEVEYHDESMTGRTPLVEENNLNANELYKKLYEYAQDPREKHCIFVHNFD